MSRTRTHFEPAIVFSIYVSTERLCVRSLILASLKLGKFSPKSLRVFFHADAKAVRSLSEKDNITMSAGSCFRSIGVFTLSK